MVRYIKPTVIWLFVLFVNANVLAQDTAPFRLGLQGSLGITTRTSPFSYALGLHIFGNYKLSDELTALGTIGYTRLSTKDTSLIPDYDFVPLKLGIEVFPFAVPLHMDAVVGLGIGLRADIQPNFVYGGGFGFLWGKTYDISLKYEAYKQGKRSIIYSRSGGQFALSFGYSF